MSTDKNVWGTNKNDVGEGFCPDCEREDGHGQRHYDNCPKSRAWVWTSDHKPTHETSPWENES